MERAKPGDESRKQINNCQSPSAFTSFDPYTTSTKLNADNTSNAHNVMTDNPSFDMNVSANAMYETGQETLAANLECEDDTMLQNIYNYLEKYKTGEASTASKYPESSSIKTPQSLDFWYPGMESGQDSAVAYSLGGMADQEHVFVTDQQLAMPYPELGVVGALDDYSGGRVDSAAPIDYVNAVDTDPGLAKNIGKYVRKPSSQEVANYYQAVNADRAMLVNYQETKAKQAAALKNLGSKGGYGSLLAGDYQQVKPGGDSIAPRISEQDGGRPALGTSIPGFQNRSQALGLPAGLRADLWPKPVEDFLMALKNANYTFPEISVKMTQEFGIERSPNVLSKRYRLILARDAEDSGIMQLLQAATPKLLRVLQDEMEKMDPEIMNEELRREVWEELQRKLPKVVRTLALQTRTGA